MWQVMGTVLRSEAAGSGITFYLDIEGRVVAYHCSVNHSDGGARHIGYHRLSRLMRGCGLEFAQDSDELDGLEFTAILDGDDIRDFVGAAPLLPKKPRFAWLRRMGNDWARAPISGTLILCGMAVSLANMAAGNMTNGLLWLVLCNLWIMQRGDFDG